ncbi:MAG: choice-of-anchor tandem repeat GloVer-containing protein [Ferruginibacter sp.]
MKKILLIIIYFLACIFSIQAQVLYVTTRYGGNNGTGTIIKFIPVTNNLTVAKSFDSIASGSEPWGSLVQASNKKLYGMTVYGGSGGIGVIFSFDPATSTFKKLIDFDRINGATPNGNGLMQASDGKLYGMTNGGGSTNRGVIFSYDPSSSIYTKLKDFDSGDAPEGSLIQAGNNKLYGMTTYGGSSSNGVIFSFDPTTSGYTVLKVFNKTDGANPFGSLIQASNGKLYGVTSFGGSSGNGVIFSFDPFTSNYTKLIDFDNTNGAFPQGSLIQASDGKLYGLTFQGGSNNFGVIFSFDPTTSIYLKLKNFDNPNGANPEGSLMQASDGKLYGMTESGGSIGAGVIFSFDPSSLVYTKLIDFDGTNGANPLFGAFIEVKEECAKTTFYRDADGDGYGNPNISIKACIQPKGYVTNKADCDDYNKTIHGPTTYYRDVDGDGFGNPNAPNCACKPIPLVGYVTNKTDCDDYNKTIHGPTTYYRDADGDGFGDPNAPNCACKPIPPVGYVKNNYDCDDRKKAASPDYENVRICHNGIAECIYAKDIASKLSLGWTLGICPPKSVNLASREGVGPVGNVAVEIYKEILPKQYKLSNYPNPFTGTSTIQYELPVDSKVSLKVYDLMGRTVATLVNEDKKAGSYSVKFDAGRLSRGSLFYRIIATSKDQQFEQTNKMMQIK